MADQKPDPRTTKAESEACAAVTAVAEAPGRPPESRSTGSEEPAPLSSSKKAAAASVPGTEYWLP